MTIDEFPFRNPYSPKVTTSANRPANPLVGQMIFESDTKISYIWTGANWREVSAPRYAAMLYRNAALSVTAGFATTNVNMDALAWSDSSTVFQGGANYTCPIAGLYRVTVNLELTTGLATAAGLSFGGSSLEGGRTRNRDYEGGYTFDRAVGHNMSAIGSMAAGGVIFPYVWNDNDIAGAIRTGSQFTWMQVERIGPRHDSGLVL